MEAFFAYLATKVTLAKLVGAMSARMLYLGMLAAMLIPLERLIPFHAKQRLFRPQLWIDFLHYFVGGIFIIGFVTVTYFFLPILTGWSGITPLDGQALPWWGQLLLFEAGWTLLGYWLHRFEHVWAPLWRLHSIHESTKELDWLSAFRVHPLEPALFHTLTIIPLWLLGVSLPVAIGYKLYSYLFAHVQHSNITFPIGPLKYILPTPHFHRWHHARVFDANGKPVRSFCNFAEYPFWDLLFGTFYLPDHKPTAYGNAPNVPMSYAAQLAYPFNAHHAVLRWQNALDDRFRLSSLGARIRTAITPTLDALENRLARLNLLRPAPETSPPPAAAQPVVTVQPLTAAQPVMAIQPLTAAQPMAPKETT